MTIEYKPILSEHVDAYFDLMNDESLAVNAGSVPYPITREWTAERIATRMAGEQEGAMADRALFENGALIASSGYFFRDGELEIGYSVHRNYRGRGLATMAAKLAVKLARDHRKTGPIAANYFQDNPASGRVLEKVGFEFIGEGIGQSMARPGDIPGFETKLTGDVMLSPLHESDYALLFVFQDDEEAQFQAAGGRAHADEKAFREFLNKAQQNGAEFRAILLEGAPVGYIASFGRLEKREISYWIGREFWGKGFASKALELWLEECSAPEAGLFARVVKDHPASARVLEKNNFKPVGEDRYFSDIRGADVEEIIYRFGG